MTQKISMPKVKIEVLAAWLFTVLLPLLWFWPQFLNPSFSFIDDAADWGIFQTMSADLGGWFETSGFHGEPVNGRLRPVYWLSRYFFHYLPQPDPFNPLGWFIAHYTILGTILSLSFWLLLRLSGKAGIALLGCSLWIINPKTMGNFTRLGPAEVWQIFWLSAFAVPLYFFFKKQKESRKLLFLAGSFILLFCFYFCKETSVLFLPFSIVMLAAAFWTGKGRQEWLLLAAANLFLFMLHRYLSPPITGYTSAFGVSFSVVLDNLQRYTPRIQWHFPLLILLISYVSRMVKAVRTNGLKFIDDKSCWQFGFLVLGAAFFTVLLLWALPEPRYLILTDFFFALFMALEMDVLIQAVRRHPALTQAASPQAQRRAGIKIFGSLAVIFLLLAGLSNARLFAEMKYAFGKAGHPTHYQTLKQFAEIAEPGSNVIMLFIEPELVAATSIFLRDFWGRPDLKLYGFSSRAEDEDMRMAGWHRILPEEWPEILSKIAYVYWGVRGITKNEIDEWHKQVIYEAVHSPYGGSMQLVYDDLHHPYSPFHPEGTLIWKLDHES